MFPLHDDNPTERFPFVTVTVIAICVAVFFWQMSLGQAGQAAVYAFGMIPAVLFGYQNLSPELAILPPGISIFTSMFLHGGWMHIIGNMIYLWIFGNNVEDQLGVGRFIVFYLLCGVFAALAQAVPDPDSLVPMIGASGAISGVLAAYLLIFPHAKVLVAIPIGFIITTLRIKAGWVLGMWFVIQVFNGYVNAGQQGGVAWGAHIGGFVAGLVFLPLLKPKHVKLFHPARD